MAEKHSCSQIGRLATLEAEQKALREIYSKDITNMQKQLDEMNASLKDLVKSFSDFANEMRANTVPKIEFEQAQERIEELEKFRQWLLLKIAFGSGVITIIALIINSWINGQKW